MNKAVCNGQHFFAAPADIEDVPKVIDNLREADRLELERFYAESPLEVVTSSFQRSAQCWAAYHPDGTPVSIWGVSGLSRWGGLGNIGVPWMVGTDQIRESLRDFLDFSFQFERLMAQPYDYLVNFVDAEYAGARRWLKRLGYQEGDTIKSIKGYDFVTVFKHTGSTHVR